MNYKSYYQIAALLIGSALSPLQASLVDIAEQDGEPNSTHMTPVSVQRETGVEESNVKNMETAVVSVPQIKDKEKVVEEDKQETPKVILDNSSNPSLQQLIYEEQMKIRLEKIKQLGSGEYNTVSWMTKWVAPMLYQQHLQELKDLDQEGHRLVGKGPSKLKLEEALEFKQDAISKLSKEGLVVLPAPEVNLLVKMHKNSFDSLSISDQDLVLFEKLLFLKMISNLNTSIINSVEILINTVEFQMGCEMYTSKLKAVAAQEEASRLAILEAQNKEVVITSEPKEGTSAPSSSVVGTVEIAVDVKQDEKLPEDVTKDVNQTGESK